MTKQDVVVRRNVVGHGWDVENSAAFGTRHKFPEYNLCSEVLPMTEMEMFLIQELDGVVGISVFVRPIGDPYTLNVKKALAFSWEELEPKILELLGQRAARLERKETEDGQAGAS